MVEALCTNIFRDKNGSIQYIRIMDSYGNSVDVQKDVLIKMIKKKKLHVRNLRITNNHCVVPIFIQ